MPASPLKQSRQMSLVEALVNIAVGYGVAVAMQILAFPLFGLDASLEENLALGVLFTIASVCRSYRSFIGAAAIAAPSTGASPDALGRSGL